MRVASPAPRLPVPKAKVASKVALPLMPKKSPARRSSSVVAVDVDAEEDESEENEFWDEAVATLARRRPNAAIKRSRTASPGTLTL